MSLQSTLKLPSLLHRESTVNEWQNDHCGKAVFEPFHQMLTDHVQKVFGNGDKESDEATMQLLGMAEMPLLSILQFRENDLPMPADEIVNMLLGQVYGTSQ